MGMGDMGGVYMLWSLLLLAVWAGVYLLRRRLRRKLLWMGWTTALLGLSEPLFVPRYWSPPTLFDLAARTGFDLESLVFAFAAGGLAACALDALTGREPRPLPAMERDLPRHRWHRLALLSPVLLFIPLHLLTPLNPIYSACLALAGGALSTAACRPDLAPRLAYGALIFLAIYFVFFWSLAATHPSYVPAVWNLPALSGVLLLGVPLEELLFAATLGAAWSGFYEHVFWRRAAA